jgi:hypothetical protein
VRRPSTVAHSAVKKNGLDSVNAVRRRLLGASSAAALNLASGAAVAQLSSGRTLRIVLTAPPGSSIDVLGRVVAEKLRERLGHTVLVENKAAAGGTVGTQEIATAAPDGNTIGLSFTVRWRRRRFFTRSFRMTRSRTWRQSCWSAQRQTCWRCPVHCRSIRSKSFLRTRGSAPGS